MPKIKSFRPKLHRKDSSRPTTGSEVSTNSTRLGVSSWNDKPTEPSLQRPQVAPKPAFTKGLLKLIPLGGVGLVQKNMYVYEYEDDIIIIDCGVGFPDEGMPGVDLIIPDISYLRDKIDKIRGIIITHAHDDHTGALPYLWPELKAPIYSQTLTCGFIRTKFIEHKLPKDVIKPLKIDDTLELGVFKVSFYQVSHSVPDSTGIVLDTPVGRIVHQSDFKVDWTPVNGQTTDVGALATLGAKGIDFMTIDCLGADRQGYTPSEIYIEGTFERVERETKGKLLITLMTSNITRIQQAINVAVRSGRKVVIAGRSMENNTQVARDLGYLDVPPELIIHQEAIKQYPDNKLLIILAGSLGQPGSALSRAGNNDHKYIQIKKTDTVVFSADPMPSAVVNQNVLIDQLSKIGCRVVASVLTPELHVSGHASMEEIKMMISLGKPKYLMPIGGEYHSMVALSKLAQSLGYNENQILIPDEGEVVNITPQRININGRVKTSNVYVDGLGVGDVGSIVLRDRQLMAEEGIVIVLVPFDQQSNTVNGEPDVVSRGFVFEKGSGDLMEAAQDIVMDVLKNKKGDRFDWRYIRHELENTLEKFFYQELKRQPLILPIIVEV